MYKFRTMVENAADIGSFQTAHNDPRITKLGHFLRQSSFDEVPQLINVLKGDMSLVGPRPDTPMQRNLYTTLEWGHRTSVRPGITGLAQVTYRSLANHEDRLTMDLDYIERQNFWLDCKILLMTFGKITGRGVN